MLTVFPSCSESPACYRIGMSTVRNIVLGLLLAGFSGSPALADNRVAAFPVAPATIVERTYTESRNGGSCVGYNGRYPSGSTVACMVQPGPNNLCGGPLGLTVKLWTCSNGQWVVMPQRK